MSSHILELAIYELKKVFNKKIIAGGQYTVDRCLRFFFQTIKTRTLVAFHRTGLKMEPPPQQQSDHYTVGEMTVFAPN
jgi:hypothetical protein